MKLIVLLFLLTVLTSACSLKKYPYESDSPIIIPKVLEIPDTNHTGIGHITFMPDGYTCYYLAQDNGKMAIKFSHFENGAWSIGETCDFSVDMKVETPCVSPDGNRFFFTGPSDKSKSSSLFYLERKSDKWSKPQVIKFQSDSGKYFDGSPTCARNGNLYFFSNRAGGWKIFCSAFTNGLYGKPEMLKGKINNYDAEELYIAPDESFLLVGRYISNTNIGDIYISFQKNGFWSDPKSLGPKVNTPEYEGRPCASPDGKYLFFTRGNQGNPSKIYQIELNSLL